MDEDVLIIADRLVQQFNRELGREVMGFSDGAKDKLLEHMWPGNVRELRNVLERAMIFTRGSEVTADDLTLAPPGRLGEMHSAGEAFQFPMNRTLKDLEKAYIQRTLETNDSSYADIADTLGISKKTLWDKRKRYDLDEVVDR
jgi:DNA-binding NtrC family response regulator